jgi:hypothetical protein
VDLREDLDLDPGKRLKRLHSLKAGCERLKKRVEWIAYNTIVFAQTTLNHINFIVKHRLNALREKILREGRRTGSILCLCLLTSRSEVSKCYIKMQALLTINVPVVYMGRYKVVLRGDYP